MLLSHGGEKTRGHTVWLVICAVKKISDCQRAWEGPGEEAPSLGSSGGSVLILVPASTESLKPWWACVREPGEGGVDEGEREVVEPGYLETGLARWGGNAG